MLMLHIEDENVTTILISKTLHFLTSNIDIGGSNLTSFS